MQKVPGSTLSSMPCQTITVSPEISDLVELCPNILCNNPRNTFSLGICLWVFYFPFIFTKNVCFEKFIMKRSSDWHLNHVIYLQPLRSVQLLSEWRELKGNLLWPLLFLCRLISFPFDVNLHSDFTLIEKKKLSVFLT